MLNLLDLLVSYYNFSIKKDAYFSIAQYFLNHLDNVDQINSKDIVNSCYTSSSTVNKFCEMLGLPNLNAFKQQLKSSLYMKKLQVTTRHQQMNLHNSYLTYLSCCHDKKVMSEKDFLSILENIADEIYKADKIVLYGSVFPAYLSSNFQVDMYLTGKQIKNYYAWVKDNENEIDENTLLFMVSYTGTHLTTKNDISFPLVRSTAKKVFISQIDYADTKISNLLHSIVLPNANDCAELNYVLLILLDVVRWFYFEKYYFNKKA